MRGIRQAVSTIVGLNRGAWQGLSFWLANIVKTMPVAYATDGQGNQAIVHLHYFTAGADWYITERDCETEQLQAFGKTDLGYGGELGYISLVEILECGAELDLYWQPRKLSEI